MEDMKPLWNLSEAFKELAATVDSQTADMKLAPFSHACTLIVPLLGSLGIAFKFAELYYAARVNDLVEASKSIETLQALVDGDLEANTVRNPEIQKTS
ncbi:hypothetical protein CJ030_MR1G004487 [Morella rubra]|uniref:Glycolipid transfer protein domain-containing protein n=1 Tax=Morella rubra TaxID=262757 RepID=A0A6A1WR76_9ROSI|nr:hypothetical protein CJ030_MR1G004487 [Morella rubra]